MNDFFISYTQADRDWAEWIGWVLEEAGYPVRAWLVRPRCELDGFEGDKPNPREGAEVM
jgi:hypothetical protein